MKKAQDGFGAIEIILIVVVVGLLAAVGWLVYDRQKSPKTSTANSTTKQSPTKAEPAKDETTDWTVYASQEGRFSLRYPNSWVQPTHKDFCTKGLFDRTLYLGPDSDSVLVCGSEFFGQMVVGSVEGSKVGDYDLGADYKNVIQKDVTVDGVSGLRISGVAKAVDNPPPLEGTIEVHYVFFTNGITYFAKYTQVPKGDKPSADVLNDFDLMVTKTLKFSFESL